jgi:prepilin-type N-terminal cleavage/methylation domain-containing protein
MVTMKKLQQPKGSRGFTLIELMISVCIMAIAFAGLATMQIACINGNAIASNLTIAITLAQDTMEELVGRAYTDTDLFDNNAGNNNFLSTAILDLNGGVGTPATQDDGHRDQNIDAQGNAGGIYTRTWNVADNQPVSGRKTVVIHVLWQTHQVSVSSIVGAPFS